MCGCTLDNTGEREGKKEESGPLQMHLAAIESVTAASAIVVVLVVVTERWFKICQFSLYFVPFDELLVISCLVS